MLTIIREGNAQVIEKKSKFIAKAIPVQNEEETLLKITEIKKSYYDASHNVFAYRIGEQSETTRFSDDGEPNGTAGLPVLDVLRVDNIQNTLIVVTRYFGGTLLGTGGLVRCYGKAASQALSDAGVVKKILCRSIHVEVPYNFLGKLQYCAAQNEYIIHDIIYTDTVRLTFHIEDDKTKEFLKIVGELTNGSVKPDIAETVYIVKARTS